MKHIFFSYSRKDSETVDQIGARLNKDGFNVWIDREEIKGGELWREAIVKAVDNAYAFVLMLSPNSAASDNVRKEVDLAEGSNKDLVPVVLASVELPAKLRYQLAGIQWIEYYKDHEEKYNEFVEVLQTYKQISVSSQMPDMREVELVISKINLSKFGPEQQEKLLNFIAEITNTPRAELNLVKMTPGSVHAFVNMPADSAYQLKTAALNRNSRLLNFGIDALRLSGDLRHVLLKTGSIAPLKTGISRARLWFIGSVVLVIALVLSSIFISSLLPHSVVVPGNVVWYDTKIKVSKGQSINFFASGTVNTYGGIPESNTEPNGSVYICPSVNPSNKPDCLINGEPYGKLVGKIGNGAPFPIGAQLIINASSTGNLFLAINDDAPYFDDNSGSYQVRITIK